MRNEDNVGELVEILEQLEELTIQLGRMQDAVGGIFERIQTHILEEVF